MAQSRPIGATTSPHGVEYRVWAADHSAVSVVITSPSSGDRTLPLSPEGDGYFAGTDLPGQPGDRYAFCLGESPDRVPDAASRFQPDGVMGASEVIDPNDFRWKDHSWKRPPLRGRTIYELHIGTFTAEGSYRSTIGRLDELVRLGINTIELMPLGDFPGRWNWGYDGVLPYAPARCYGRPNDLRALVDAAHQRGLAVILDVVYNHLGPVGNHLPRYSKNYLHSERSSPWGQSLNFDGPDSGPVRRFFVQNAAYWIDEFHIDGLRLDATHAVHDTSPQHLFAAVAAAATERGAFTIAEDERNDALIISPQGARAWKVDGVWADDFHHSVRVALTGDRHSYFAAYRGGGSELAEILDHGWLYRGQPFLNRKEPRGTEGKHLPPRSFVHCIDNHDQSGNRALGERLAQLSDPAAYRAAAMLLCLSPYTPMFFMGDEWAASSPFCFFTDHPGEIGEKMGYYRRQEFAAQGPEVLGRMPEPQAESTFQASRLNWDERALPKHAQILALHREALALRNAHAHFQSPDRSEWSVQSFRDTVALRWKTPAGDWLLLVILRSRAPESVPAAIAAVRPGKSWKGVLSSEDPRFGGAAQEGPFGPDGSMLAAGPGAVLYREG
jgi:maltooligosyltrehalose trehalohydrolase